MAISHFIFHLITFILTSFSSSSTSEIILSFNITNSPWKPSQNKTLISPNFTFSAGFRSLPNSPNLFIFSIWYSNLSYNTTIWSANSASPVRNSASFIINPQNVLQLTDGGSNLWPNSTMEPNSTRVRLHEDGNLVFGKWQSFHYPTDTIVPTQNISSTLRSQNGKFYLNGSGNLNFNGSDTYWSASNGLSRLDKYGFLVQGNGNPLTPSDFDQIRTRKLTLDNDGNLRLRSFNPGTGKWVIVWRALTEICLVHGLCRSGSICYSDGSTDSGYECMCPPGYRWAKSGSGSCTRKTPIKNFGKSKFLALDFVNYSGGSNQTDLQVTNFTQCESNCLVKSNCLGFGFKYDGMGYCVLQLDRLLHGYWSPATESVFYLRVDGSESDRSNFTGISEVLTTSCPINIALPNPPDDSDETTRNIVIITILFTIEIASGGILLWAFLTRFVKYRDMARTLGFGSLPMAGPKKFSYAEIKVATKNFSNDNVIGKGGFSDVYKGKLEDGRLVAVKCLKNVTSGDGEFWAEVSIIARMHHLNLVHLWGFCYEKSRRILIYEHVSNGSLDKHLFGRGHICRDDPGNNNEGLQRKPILDWSIRYRIALGVARAIAYLHEECLEWVLHCDIKPENILLGEDFCPKVADFGLSKLRKKEQLVTKSMIRGTRGYLAPEWTRNEPITSKVDVYSFGMVLLEIVIGVRNTSTGPSTMASEEWYVPAWAFEVGIEKGKIDEILDHQIKQSYDSRVHAEMVDRMVKTAMWCLQARPEDRPSMGKVAKMLEGTIEIIDPPKPTFYFMEGEQSSFSNFSSNFTTD